MNDFAIAAKADKYFQERLAAYEGKPNRAAVPEALSLTIPGLDTFCRMAPGIIALARKLLDSWLGMFIPDKTEALIKAFLDTVETVVLPFICPQP